MFMLCCTAFAAEVSAVEVIDCGNGFTVEITSQSIYSTRSSTVAKTKTATAKQDGVKIGEFVLIGKFEYDGTTAKAVNADCDATSYNGWGYKNVSCSYSGAKVSGKCTFYSGSLSKSVSLSMTCSPSGVIS